MAVALLCSHAGWGTLSMTMTRHAQQAWGAGMWRMRGVVGTMRTLATLLLILSTVPLVFVWGGSIGVVAWCGVLSISSVLLALQLHYASRTLRFTVSLAALSAAVIAMLAQFAFR